MTTKNRFFLHVLLPVTLFVAPLNIGGAQDDDFQVLSRSEPVEFVTHEQEYPMSIQGVDDFAEIKYVAEITLPDMSIRNVISRGRPYETSHSSGWNILLFGNQDGRDRSIRSQSNAIEQLTDLGFRMSAVLELDDTPAAVGDKWKDIIHDIDCRIKVVFSSRGRSAPVSIFLLATSQDNALTAAKSLVEFVDEVISIPHQTIFVNRLKKNTQELTDLEQQVAERKKVVASMQEEHAELEKYSTEDAREFRNRLKMLEIDIVGQKAKLEGCERLLKEVSGSQATQLQNLKIAAQVELMGLEATRKKVQELFDEVNQFEKSRRRVSAALISLQQEDSNVRGARSTLSNLRDTLESYRTVKIAENQIGIYPVKWTAN